MPRLLLLLACCVGATALAQAPSETPAEAGPAQPSGNVERELDRLKRLPAGQAAKPGKPTPSAEALRDVARLRRSLPDVGQAPTQTEPEWVLDEARIFFNHMLAGDARSLVDHSGFPFQLEERRLATPEEGLQEWLKALRAKRTDLLTLYGIELLTPAEMEKKYGKAPPRLQALPWRGPRTYLAVGNLSGRAGVAVLKDLGARGWKVVAYHD